MREGGEGGGDEPEDMVVVVVMSGLLGYMVGEMKWLCDRAEEGDFIFVREHDGL